jgi:predicted ATPase/class 3 adenylate cyclase
MAFDLGPYQIRDALRRGNDVSVYSAMRRADGQPFVVKLANQTHPSPAVAGRHNGAARCRHLVTQESHGSGTALIFSACDGADLADFLAGLQLPIGEFLLAAIQMTEAVAAVHDKEIIHRDICPANFIVSSATGEVTLIDFDRATLTPRESVEVRSPGALEGELAYISPEQTGRMNRSVDYRTDLYSLGATFYQMLTGAPPFLADQRLQLIHQLIAQPPAPPSNARRGLPAVIDAIVLRLLAKAPELRYQSAAGLLADLRACQLALKPDGSIDSFEIATADIPNRFHIPERLYGREAELDTIFAAFKRAVDERSPTLLLVSGDPGIGKSSLVNEIHKPIIASAGYFISGKFDQLNRNQPLAPLIAALRDLVRQALTESDSSLRRHRARLEGALASTARVVVDAVPELERLIGPQQAVPDLPPLESQNRFREAFRAFVQAFARPEHPLCMLLDDVQWADSATLEWIEATLRDRSLGALLLVAAYRDAEVPASHPFALAVDRLAGAMTIEQVRLAPLSVATTRRIVCDTMARDDAVAAELAEIVQQKTYGNPFFINQLLRSLYLDGSIRYSSAAWTCDLGRIRAAEITENVVDFLTARLRDLPRQTQEILEVAACVGARFDLDMLTTVSQFTPAEIQFRLQEALDHGLIHAIGQGTAARLRYRFQHDRVQQAAYRLMDSDEERRVRLLIGRRLLADSADPANDDRLFEILQQLNASRGLLTDREEQLRIARLNLAAAARARRSTAYAQAREFAAIGLELLPSDPPQRLAFELTLERAECEHLAGDDAAAETYFALADPLAADDFDRAEVYERIIQFHTNQARFDRAFAAGLTAARMFGIRLPSKFSPPVLARDYLRIKFLIGGRPPMALLDHPDLQDRRLRLGIHFMALVGKSAYQIRPELCVLICARIVYLSLRHGYTEDTAVGYLAYGVIFRGGVLGDHKTGDEFGQLTLSLVDRFRHERIRAEVNFVYGYFANSWIRGLANSEELFNRAYQSGIDVGDFFHASCACSGIAQNMLMRGVELETVQNMTLRFEGFLRRVQTTDNIGTMQAIQQTIANLRGETNAPDSFSNPAFDEPAFVATLSSYGSPHFAHMYWVNKLFTLVLWGRLDEADAAAAASEKLLKDSPGMQHAAEHHFLSGLLQARRGRRWKTRRAAGLLRKWAKDAPATFAHKQYLLEAELHRLSGRFEAAARFLDQAIEAAEAAGYRQVQALAHRYAGELHLQRGAMRTAKYHLQEASLGFQRWGATGLAAEILRRHEALLGGLVLGADAEASRTKSPRGGDSLDLETVLQAARAISGEVQLSELFRQLMAILRQNAGAERAALLLVRDGQIAVEAEIDGQGDTRLLSSPIDEYTGFARSVVNFVLRSEESLILEDAASEIRFHNDPYVMRLQARSIMCVPLHYLGELSGVLYLENNLTVGAFTKERIEILKLLSGQIGISIANAQLYEQLEEKVRLRTAQLETRNRFISRTFGRYLSDEIVELLLQSTESGNVSGEKREVTLLYSDLRGFTPLVESLRPEDVVTLMNTYLGVMTEVLTAHQATIIDFVGDAILAIFGAPTSHGDDAARAVACAIDMQRAMARVNRSNAGEGYPPIDMGIGINTGEVIVGSIGSEKRAKYTVLGSHVNLAARIEGYSVGGDVLVSASTRAAVGPILQISAEVKVEPKGVGEPVVISYVRAIGGKYQQHLAAGTGELALLSPPLRVRYTLVDHKQLRGEETEALIEALTEREADLRGPMPDVLSDLRLLLAGRHGETLQAYGKVLPQPAGVPEGCFRLAFTSLTDQTRAFLRETAGMSMANRGETHAVRPRGPAMAGGLHQA